MIVACGIAGLYALAHARHGLNDRVLQPAALMALFSIAVILADVGRLRPGPV